MTIHEEVSNRKLYEDAFNLLCGEKISWGMSRQVFACRLLPECVVKCEDHESFQNIMEWKIWNAVRDMPAARWFAPCEWLSPDGHVLIMKRTQPANGSQFAKRVPVFLNDFKRANFGMLGRRLVCHDYGVTSVLENGFVTKRLKAAKWWDEETS